MVVSAFEIAASLTDLQPSAFALKFAAVSLVGCCSVSLPQSRSLAGLEVVLQAHP